MLNRLRDLSFINDKTLLVTGGTGSFGNAILRGMLDTKVREIRIFSRDEKKQDDMRGQYDDDRIKYFIGDVRDAPSLDDAFERVDYVFHAAALKQVPSCEFYPMEAVKTNVLGTTNVLDAAVRHGVAKVICLSTDKAVYPINAMGISKALMEKVAVAKARTFTTPVITCTRYGNVMASRGSVIPLFVEQIKRGLPITVTDPQMTRFMMSLDDAIDLVIFAFRNGKPGDIFVQKAPASTILQLAETLREIFSAKNEVKIIGTRHGEKVYETLLTREEFLKADDLGPYFRVAADDRDLNYAKYFSEGERETASLQDYHSHNTHRLSRDELRELLLKLDYVREELGR
jgi:UDP-glucose 4-epimerase